MLIVSALIMGLVMGLLGGGGAIITVPALVYLAGLPVKVAIPTALGVVGFVALVSGLGEWRAGKVHFEKAIPVSLSGMVGSYLGARIGANLDDKIQMILFAVVVFLAASFMIRNALKGKITGKKSHSVPLLLIVGLFVGAMGGMLGVGGGFLIVPALVLFAGMKMKESVGTALLIIAMNATTGILGYIKTVEFHWGILALFAFTGVAGSIAGTKVRHLVPEKKLKLTFAGFLLIVGSYIFSEKMGFLS